jgi:hypothetical protein
MIESGMYDALNDICRLYLLFAFIVTLITAKGKVDFFKDEFVYVQNIKAYKRSIIIALFQTSALDGGEWSAKRCSRFTPVKETL